MAGTTLELLQANKIEVGNDPSPLPPEFECVLTEYPGAADFFRTTYPLLETSKRAGGFTNTFEVVNQPEQPLGYRRFREDVRTHTGHIARIVSGLYERYPGFANIRNSEGRPITRPSRIFAAIALHDMQEIFGGDIPQSIPNNFYMDPGYIRFLESEGQDYLLSHIYAGRHEIINNGHKEHYLGMLRKFRSHSDQRQLQLAMELCATIPEPATAEEFADLAYRFAHKKRYLDDTGIWLARWGDIAQETETIFGRDNGATVEAYQSQPGYEPFGDKSDARVVMEAVSPELRDDTIRGRKERPYFDDEVIGIKSVGLTIGRLLEPAIVLLYNVKDDPELFRGMYNETRKLLEILHKADYPMHTGAVLEAANYLQRAAGDIMNGRADIHQQLVEIEEWIHRAKRF